LISSHHVIQIHELAKGLAYLHARKITHGDINDVRSISDRGSSLLTLA
jgi:serine/threonine protein kinase